MVGLGVYSLHQGANLAYYIGILMRDSAYLEGFILVTDYQIARRSGMLNEISPQIVPYPCGILSISVLSLTNSSGTRKLTACD